MTVYTVKMTDKVTGRIGYIRVGAHSRDGVLGQLFLHEQRNPRYTYQVQ